MRVQRVRRFLKVAFPGREFYVKEVDGKLEISAYEFRDWETGHRALQSAGLVESPFENCPVKEEKGEW